MFALESLKNNYLKAFGVFLLVVAIFLFTSALEYTREKEHQEQKLKESLSDIEDDIQTSIAYKIVAASGFKDYIGRNPTFDQEEFSDFGEEIYGVGDDVMRNISFLTDTTITHTYPYEENKSGIGRDLAEIEAQKDWILCTKRTKETIFTAPVELVEGGTGFIVRIPVESDGDYLGQISMVFDYNKIIEYSGVKALSEDMYVTLVSKDGFKASDSVVWSNLDSETQVEDDEVDSVDIELYDSKLTIRAFPKEGFSGKSSLFYIIIATGALISSVSGFVSYKLLSTNEMLRQNQKQLGEAQTKLMSKNEDLKEMVDKLESSEEHISFLAERDLLTNLFNRRKCSEDISYHIERDGKGSVILIDIDNFKNINDTLGHSYGDKVLKHLGNLLLSKIPHGSTAYRVGGDEFVVHMPSVIEYKEIKSCVDTVFKSFKMHNSIESIKNHITASVGVAIYPIDAITSEEVIMKADIAMYDAKKLGKNRCHYFSDDMMRSLDWKVNLESDLRDAVENGKFKLLYQPVIDAGEKRIAYFEALIRMANSDLSPAVFIGVAEEIGLIVPIGEWVVKEAIRQLLEWKEEGHDLKPVAINVSPLQIRQENFVGFLKEQIESSGIDPSLIEIEITETVLMENRDENIRSLKAIRDLGMGIALDDFGTGYSSLSYLAYLPVTKVKLDKSIKDRFVNFEEAQVMEGIISICHGLKFKVVTEGVEDEEEYSQLLVQGTDYVQGYFFSKPLLPEDAVSFSIR